jgi:hypothetical protein
MTRYSLDTTGDGERDNPKAFMREDPEGAWVLGGGPDVSEHVHEPIYDTVCWKCGAPMNVRPAAREGQGLDVEHCPCEDHLQARLSDGCRCTDHVHEREDIAAQQREGAGE